MRGHRQLTKKKTRVNFERSPHGSNTIAAVAVGVHLIWTTGAAQIFNPAPGSWAGLPPGAYQPATPDQAYSATDRIVLTPYFYWYDVWSEAHLRNPDGSDALTTHPPTLTGFSYKSRQWHQTQLLDMSDAGIDVLLPVYWGAPSELAETGPGHWSYAGLPPLIDAREALLDQGRSPPSIGLFYDTTTLGHNVWNRRWDLTTADGQAFFYESIRDFFSLVPPRHWATIDGNPVVFLYVSTFALDHDQRVIATARRRFREDFGGLDLFIVKELTWNVDADQTYSWGGALGLKNPGVASLGPGYDDSAVPGRQTFRVDREAGDFFERQWQRFLRDPSPLVMIETWNEYHEGTEIAESAEYGRHYIERNRHYADLFKSGVTLPPAEGPYTHAESVSIDLGQPNDSQGLTQFEWADGLTEPVTLDGVPCRRPLPNLQGGRYLYFRADDSFKWAGAQEVELTLTFWDVGNPSFTIEYHGSDPQAPFLGAYTSTGQIHRGRNTLRWQTQSVRLPRAKFANAQNGGGDFRINILSGTPCFRSVSVSKSSSSHPTDSRPSLKARGLRGRTLTIQLSGQSQTRYLFERSPGLNPPRWQPIATRFIDSQTDETDVDLPIDPTAPQAFYRARPVAVP